MILKLYFLSAQRQYNFVTRNGEHKRLHSIAYSVVDDKPSVHKWMNKIPTVPGCSLVNN